MYSYPALIVSCVAVVVAVSWNFCNNFHAGNRQTLPHWARVTNQQSVELVQWSGPGSAVQVYQRRTPVVLQQSPLSRLRCHQTWTPTYIKKHVRKLSDVIISNSTQFLHYDVHVPASKHKEDARRSLNIDWKAPYRLMTEELDTAAFFNVLVGGSKHQFKHAVYSNDLSAWKGTAPFDDVDKSAALAFADRLGNITFTVWMGGGTTTPPHYDAVHNFFVQVYGHKQFVLFEPNSTADLYMYPYSHPHNFKSQIDFTAVNLTTFPRFEGLQARTVTLAPGDVLYVPPYWVHRVTALDTSLSLSLWIDAEECFVLDELVEIPLPFERSWFARPALLRGSLALYLSAVLSHVDLTTRQAASVSNLLSSRYATFQPYRGMDADGTFPAHLCDPSLLDTSAADPSTLPDDLTPLRLFDGRKINRRAKAAATLLMQLSPGVRVLKTWDYIERATSFVMPSASPRPFYVQMARHCSWPYD